MVDRSEKEFQKWWMETGKVKYINPEPMLAAWLTAWRILEDENTGLKVFLKEVLVRLEKFDEKLSEMETGVAQ